MSPPRAALGRMVSSYDRCPSFRHRRIVEATLWSIIFTSICATNFAVPAYTLEDSNVPRMVALSVGVGGAPRLDFLPAAVNSSRAFHDWAVAMGYQSQLVTDEEGPVTVAGLKKILETILKPPASPIYRLVLYFAGHGLIQEMNERLWLLSDWDADLRAVAVNTLKSRLTRYGVQQIAIFTDACRSLPTDIDQAGLVPDGVLGKGPIAPNVPDVENFSATQDGARTYSIPGQNPVDDRCIFSGVLLEGLWGMQPLAFSKVRTTAVTGSSLGTYLKSEVPKIAKRYKRD